MRRARLRQEEASTALEDLTLYPWHGLPRIDPPITLRDVAADLDDLFSLPDGSAVTLGQVDPATHQLFAARWRDSGSTGFYPASTIKWITAAMAVAWMEEHRLDPDTVIAVGDDRPATLRELILSSLVMSDNEAFNTLQEAVGFAETHAAMQRWGVQHALIRRHFTRPHWNHSRAVQVFPAHGKPWTLDARPPANIPLNADARPTPLGNPESNYFTTDDFVIAAAATLMGPTRDARGFPLLTQGLGWTNQNYIRQGLTELTAHLPGRPGFVTLSKPGWWPPDGANSEVAYIYDVKRDRHFFLAIYIQGSLEVAEQVMPEAARQVFKALSTDQIEILPAAE